MTLGDFSSLVQLGVGLHVGTALFQLFSEFGLNSIERRIDRLDSYVEKKRGKTKKLVRDQIQDLKTSIAIFKIQAFNEYRRYVIFNFVVAMLLLAVLVAISFRFSCQLHWFFAVVLAISCCAPAITSLIVHWQRASKRLGPIKKKVERTERQLFPAAISKPNSR